MAQICRLTQDEERKLKELMQKKLQLEKVLDKIVIELRSIVNKIR